MALAKMGTEILTLAQAAFAEGHRCHGQGQFREALSHYEQVAAVLPDHPEVLVAIATVLHELERYEEALQCYRRAQVLAPPTAVLCHNFGNTLLALDRYAEAIEWYGKALELNPQDAEALVTMGTALEQLGKYPQALLCYEEALRRQPACAEAHWNLALALLRLGQFDRGWAEFAWRWRKKGYTTARRSVDVPEWRGEPLAGKRILIHAEQAFGDAIQFARYLQPVADLGARVVFECPEQLVQLFEHERNCWQVIASGADLPQVDCHVPLLSLPAIFRTNLDSIPLHIPYLNVSGVLVKHWQELVGHQSGRKIGLVWAGRRRPDPHRSCPLSNFAPLAHLPDTTWYSLQVGEGAEQVATQSAGMMLVDLTARIGDFADTAAMISCLDLVVSIDTAVAHLAGAMGKPTFLLVPFAPDWRWMLQRDDSPWYPTMRIFRQRIRGEWGEVIAEIAAALTHRLAG